MEKPKIATNRRALADLQYNSLLAKGNESSSGDEASELADVQDAAATTGAIGVSIGKQQTRFNSPTTPAVEKAAAIDEAGGFFGKATDGSPSGVPDTLEDREGEGEVQEDDQPSSDDEPRITSPRSRTKASPNGRADGSRKPSPWRAEYKQVQRTDKSRSILRDGFSFGRKRASSGPESKSIFPSFPSMPKNLSNFSLSYPFSSSRDGSKPDDRDPRARDDSSRQTAQSGTAQSRSPVKHRRGSSSRSNERSAREAEEALATVAELPSDLRLNYVQSRPQPLLRRSTSDTSLVTQRTLSRVSSLGDDSRFEDVSAQVNSRFKAIKDSLQDSSIRMPSMPSIAHFNMSHFTPDFMTRERSGSSSARASMQAISNGSIDQSKHSRKPVDPMTRQPYTSAKAAVADAPLDRSKIQHPHFDRALDRLQGDVVVLGGYRGSILRSAEPPHRQLWVPIKVGLNLRKVDLEVDIAEDGDERASEKVIPGGMLQHIGPVDISRRLLKRIRACDNAQSRKLRVHDYGYDWRLHPAYLSKRLIKFLESLPCNRPGVPKEKRGATIIAHSLGGLITRHAVNQRPDLFAGVVYAGVPKTCVNILGPLRNGDEVLLSSRVLTAQVNFTIRTSFVLLPLNGRCFFDKTTKEEYPVDFFDPQTWIDYRLSPCVGRPLPPLIAQPKPAGITGYVSSMASALPSLPVRGRKSSLNRNKGTVDPSKATNAEGIGAAGTMDGDAGSSGVAMANGNINESQQSLDASQEQDSESSPRTAVTIPRDEAIQYLTRTLATVKKFKQELSFEPKHQLSNAYPPISVIYGKSTPTVFGAKVNGREGIKHADAYDELAFASGDGVVLARAAMVPEGYKTAPGGIISSERGHVTLLGDLEAVGKCLNAVVRARRKGVGLGS